MFWRAWVGTLLFGGLLSSLTAQETHQELSASDRRSIVLEIGERPERAIRGLSESAPGDQEVEAALDRIVTLRCHEAPLGEVAQEIERQLGIPIHLFNESWAGEETDPNLKVSIEVDGVPLASAIEALAGPETLSVFTDNGKLVIAHSRRGHEVRTTRIYHVPRLQQLGMPHLSKLITAWTSGPWDDDEPGTGTISPYGDALVVRQTLRNHREIEAFLSLLTQAYLKLKPGGRVSNDPAGPSRGKASPTEMPPRSAVSIEPLRQPGIELTVSDDHSEEIHGHGEFTPGDWKVETALRQIVTLRCRDVPLENVAREIERKLEIPVRFASGPHPDETVDPKQRVSIEAYNVPLHRAINCVGDDPVRSYVAGGTILLFPAGGCDNIRGTRIYPVARFQAVGLNLLSDLIVQETSGPWDDDEPGTGTISSFGNTLVIRQTPMVHREIDTLLDLVDRLDIQPLPGEQAWKNAAAVVATEGPAIGLRSGNGSTPTRAQLEWISSLGDLAFRSSEREEKLTEGSARPDPAASDSPASFSMRFDASAALAGGMHGAGDRTPEEVKVEIALKRIVTIRCVNLPLEEFARQIERAVGIPVRLQVGRPPELGVDPREKISIEVYGVPLEQALFLGRTARWIANDGELRFVHREWESEEPRRTRVYPVARFRALELERLSELIHDETSGPWDEDEPGTGTLEVTGETFVIHQTSKVHREIEDLLELIDRLDIRPLPRGQQVVRPLGWQGGGLGGGFFGGGIFGGEGDPFGEE